MRDEDIRVTWRDRLAYYLHPVRLVLVLSGTEWSENWRAWPHCNGQDGCWMHITSAKPWCRCRCGWCRIARRIRRLDTTPALDRR